MNDNHAASILFWIKLIHTLAFLVIGAAILYIIYSGVFDVGGTALIIALIIVVAEIVVFTANGFHCPLTKIAQQMGDATGNDFIGDIFLPKGFARLVPLVCGSLAFIGFVLVGVRLLIE